MNVRDALLERLNSTELEILQGSRLSCVLDISRWSAAALVVIYHVTMNVMADPATVHPTIGWNLLYILGNCGPQAVIWFFIISGFLVGGKIIADIRRGRFRYGSYLFNRLTRLYVVLIPALAVGYSLDLLRVHAYGINIGAASETHAAYGLWPFVANLLFLQTLDSPILGSNIPLWSLACEGWYYVLFPLLLLPVLPSLSLVKRITCASMAIVIVGFLTQRPQILHMFLFWLMGAGVWFCPPLLRSRTVGWLAVVPCLIAYPFFPGHFLKTVAAMAVAISFANVLLVARHAPDQANLPRARFHAYLAGFSYSLYLTHAPMIHFILTLAKGSGDPRLSLAPSGWRPLAWEISLIALLVAYGYGFSRLTEVHTDRVRQVARSLSVRLKYRLLCGGTVLALVLTFAYASRAAVPPLSAPIDWPVIIAEQLDLPIDRSRRDIHHDWEDHHPLSRCFFGGQRRVENRACLQHRAGDVEQPVADGT